MSNIHLIGIEAREKAFIGADKVATAVEASMGPAGQNLLLEDGNTTTNDGKRISHNLSESLTDEFERRGAIYQHQGSVRVEKEVKDSTSTYFSLSKALRKALVQYLPTKSVPIAKKPISELRNQLQEEYKVIDEKLKEMAKPISSREELIASAMVSVEDKELAEMIGGTQWDLTQKSGDAVIMVQDTNNIKSSIEITNGIYTDSGFSSALLINNQAKQSIDLVNTHVLLTNHTITNLNELTPLLSDLRISGKTVLALFSRAFSEEALASITEWAKSGMFIIPINAPFTDQGQVFLDIAAVTGATYISTETKKLSDIIMSDVGFSKSISCSRYETFVAGNGKEEDAVKDRVIELEEAFEKEESLFYKDTLRQRIACLKGALAILKVGSRTEEDRKRKHDKADDAVGAVRNALKGGTVVGAGVAFKEIADSLPDTYILKEPLYAVYRQIKNTLPEGYEVPEWVRDPYVSLSTALEIAIENSLNLSNIMAIHTAELPKDLEALKKIFK